MIETDPSTRSAAHIALVERHAAHSYHPLPVVIAEASGSWVTDVEGRRYLDCLAAYSAVNLGHGHPAVVAAARAQLDRVTLTSRAFHHDQMGRFLEALTGLCGKDMVVPMNTGAEAVETAIKVARKWAHERRQIAEPEIIVAAGNFHGRTTTIVSFSDDPVARDGFGPFTPGFRTVPYADADAVEHAITPSTAAVLIEPVQGEAGVIVPPADYLPRLREICDQHGVLLICDEIQSGLGRTGRTFASDHWDVVPDMYLLGKALGGGVVPVSAVVGDADVLGVLTPGTHGSTFGGNPLAAAVATSVIDVLRTGELQERSRVLGERLHAGLAALDHGVTAVRGLGLWAGIDIDPALGTARDLASELLTLGVLAKDTHTTTLRLAPPLVIDEDEIDELLVRLREALATLTTRAER